MTDPTGNDDDLIRVVLADANVLYSRVLRDYLLYAANQEIIAVAWSPQILAEVTEHLGQNVAGFDDAAAERLERAMNRAFPFAEVEPGEEHLRMLVEVSLPDEDDRHVLAAALAAEATVLCTSNTKDFPDGHTRPTAQSACRRARAADACRPPGGGSVTDRRFRRLNCRRAKPSRCLADRHAHGPAARRRMSRQTGAPARLMGTYPRTGPSLNFPA